MCEKFLTLPNGCKLEQVFLAPVFTPAGQAQAMQQAARFRAA